MGAVANGLNYRFGGFKGRSFCATMARWQSIGVIVFGGIYSAVQKANAGSFFLFDVVSDVGVNWCEGHKLMSQENIGQVRQRSLLCRAAQNTFYPIKAVTRSSHSFPGGIQNVVVKDWDRDAQLIAALENVDVVVHLAARVHVMREASVDALSAYRQANVEGALQVARNAATAGVRRFVYLSSIKVNGECTKPNQPFTADDVPAPEDPYGVSKMEAESALLALSAATGMEVTIIRPPLVYGPGVGANFASMMRWVNYRLPLPLGAIKNRRSMIALGNLVDLILTATEHPNAAGQIFLASDDQDISVSELLRKIAKLLNVSLYLIPVPPSALRFLARMLGKRNIANRLCDYLQVDIQKTRQVLEWTPSITLDQGLETTAQWFLKK